MLSSGKQAGRLRNRVRASACEDAHLSWVLPRRARGRGGGGAHVWRAVSSLDSVHSGASSNDARRREPEARGDRDIGYAMQCQWRVGHPTEIRVGRDRAWRTRISDLGTVSPHSCLSSVHLYPDTLYNSIDYLSRTIIESLLTFTF